MTRTLIATTAALAGMLALAGCTTADPGGDAPAVDGVPATPGLITAGTLTVGTTLPDAPFMIPDADNNVEKGITTDLLKAVADKLGLEIVFQNVAWEGGIAGIAAGRYDVYGGSLYDTEERQEAGTFVDFVQDQTVVTAKKDAAAATGDRLDACGHTIATIRGTTDVKYAGILSDECEAAGEDAMQVTEYPTQQDSDLALQSGRTDFGLQSVAGAEYEIENGADKGIVGDPFEGGAYVGTLMNSGNPELIDAVLWAMTELYEDGTTQKLFDAYGVTAIEPGVNRTTEG